MPHWPPWRSKTGKSNGKKAGGTTLAATPDREIPGSPAPLAGYETERSGGDWDGTWTGEANKNWLRDFLPQQLQHEGIAARILSFGYDSRTAFAKAVVDIEDVADMLLDRIEGIRDSNQEQSRPLIFIAHSLGGIVVKKAIIRAHERSQHYGALLQSTHGIVFMGVPHRGADSARWASLVANILQVGQLGWGTNTNFVEALKRNSPIFSDISRQFVERAEQLTIRTFFETERWGNQVIVDKDSAVLNLPNEIATGVPQANHSTICKFEQIDSQKYYPVWHAVKKLCQGSLSNKRTDDAGPLEEIAENLDRRQEERYENSKARDCHRAFKTSDYESQKNINPDRADRTYNENQDSLALALCALIHQLFTDQPRLIQHAIPAWEKAGDKVQREADELWRILLGASRDVKAGRTICVLDALDECGDNDRQRLIAMLAAFSRNRSTDPFRGWVKFLVTSRPYEWIQDHFQETLRSWPSIRLRGEEENDQIRQEIDLVIQEKVERLALDLQLGESTKDQLKFKLLEMKHRTYLWLYLAMEEFREQYRQSFRPHKESIVSLPSTVEDAYEKILERGAARNKDNVYKILRIVVGARRPLTVSEMAVALGVDTSPLSELELDIQKTYLETQLPQWSTKDPFQSVKVHSNINVHAINTSDNTDTFWAYSAENWAGHARSTQDEASMFLMNMMIELHDTAGERFKSWFPILWNALRPYSTQPIINSIRLAAMNGHSGVLQRLLEKNGSDLDATDEKGVTALILGSRYGYVKVVRVLLDKGANVHAQGGEYGNALQAASLGGHEQVVQMLLDKGADVHAQGGHYGNALQAALLRGHEQVVQILLDKGADVHAQGGVNGNALQAASSGGHKQVVQMLLKQRSMQRS
ncbi:MAG: hypothetical protein Q9221_008730 [Calogaya cf. arnoldii]